MRYTGAVSAAAASPGAPRRAIPSTGRGSRAPLLALLAVATLVASAAAGAGAAGAADEREWPGGASVDVLDDAAPLGRNLSGIVHDPTAPGVLWAVRDDPGALLRLERRGTAWRESDGWAGGRTIEDASGARPDAEAVTVVPGEPGVVYVGSERDNGAAGASRNRVMRVAATGSGAVRATQSWELSTVLPRTSANTGLEGLAWVPDPFVVASGVVDESTGRPYDPASHPGHGAGLFAVGVETSGAVVLVALRDDGVATRIATVPTALAAVMELTFDAVHQVLWVVCDDTCDGRMVALANDGGRLAAVTMLRPPPALQRRNHEGFAVDPTTPCTGTMAVFWVDDSPSDGRSLRRGALPCARDAVLGTATPAATTSPVTSPVTSPGSTTVATGAAGSAGSNGGGDASSGGGGVPVVPIVVAVVLAAAALGAVGVARRRSRG